VFGFAFPIPAMTRDVGDHGNSWLPIAKLSKNFSTAAWAARFSITRLPNYSTTNSRRVSVVRFGFGTSGNFGDLFPDPRPSAFIRGKVWLLLLALSVSSV